MTKPTVLEVVEKLAAQGSADQIAAFFESERVTGARKFAQGCPVAHYTESQTGRLIRASPESVHTVYRHDEPCQYAVLSGQGPVAEFMVKFDGGAYPELVA